MHPFTSKREQLSGCSALVTEWWAVLSTLHRNACPHSSYCTLAGARVPETRHALRPGQKQASLPPLIPDPPHSSLQKRTGPCPLLILADISLATAHLSPILQACISRHFLSPRLSHATEAPFQPQPGSLVPPPASPLQPHTPRLPRPHPA